MPQVRYREPVILQPLPIPAGPAATTVLPDLERALAGTAAWLPLPTDDPHRRDLLLATQRPGKPIANTALVVPTSGSTGTPKGAQLSAANLLTSAHATAERLGQGQWLLPLPAHHIAGLQVLIRSIVAGTTPVVIKPGQDFAAAAATMTGSRRLTSVVPLQLSRLLNDDLGTAALQSFDAVLCGGQATPPSLVQRARDLGINVVLTYGSSETAGGCVYDGQALAGVALTIADPDANPDAGGVGRVELTGPMVADGYRNVPGSPDFRLAGAGTSPHNTFITSDLGRMSADGTLTILGRADDVIVSGGLKILPGALESQIAQHPAVAACAVVGVPDAELGQCAVAVVELHESAPGTPEPATSETGTPAPATGSEIKEWLAGRMHRHQVPRRFIIAEQLPTLGPGKIDRAAVRELAGH